MGATKNRSVIRTEEFIAKREELAQRQFRSLVFWSLVFLITGFFLGWGGDLSNVQMHHSSVDFSVFEANERLLGATP